METKVAYQVPSVAKEPNPSGIPARWLRFLYRVAGLKRGHCYTIMLIVPEGDSEPQWAVVGTGTIENAP